jgi:carbonic anhydrase
MATSGGTCSDQYSSDMSKNVPRDVVSFEGDANSATKCIQKCMYWFNYTSASSCIVTNESNRLSIQYDGGGDVSFNSATYTPTTLRIFSPSIHKYNGVQAPAELIIEHTSKAASMAGLLVCIPLSNKGVQNGASEILTAIINNSPTDVNVAESVQLSDFNLNRIIPTAPYFTYSGPLPYDACAPDTVYQYVVFHTYRNGVISLDQPVFDQLKKLISFSYIVATKGDDVFYNPKGTSANGYNGEDQIYIQCQPTGESKEKEVYKEKINPGASGSGEAVKNILITVLYIVLGVAFVYVSFLVMKKVMEYVSHPPKEIEIVTGGGS